MTRIKKKMPRDRADDIDFDIEEDIKFKFGSSTTRVISRNVKQNEYIYPLDHNLDEFEDVDDLIKLLAFASYGDNVTIYINSDGGNCEIADLIVLRIQEAQQRGVTVVGELGFNVASAATFIALACNDLIISPSCCFLIHGWSSGVYSANAKEQLEHSTFNKKQSDKFLRRTYQGFMTEDEIEDLIENPRDILMDAEEVEQRWLTKVGDSGASTSQQVILNDLIEERVLTILQEKKLIKKPRSKAVK